MKCSLTKVLLLSTALVVGMLCAYIYTAIHVYPDEGPCTKLPPDQQAFNITNSTELLTMYDDPFVFMQITDLHISQFRDYGRVVDLMRFCEQTLEAIRPVAVIASGDLTDARTSDSLASGQREVEWAVYRRVLRDSGATNKTVWLDLRGNHDTFNVLSGSSEDNYFSNYSVQGSASPRSYKRSFLTASGKAVTFMMVDASPDPGPKWPFNFMGFLTDCEARKIRAMIKEMNKTGNDYSIWAGHYPTSCVLSFGQSLRDLVGSDPSALAYLCGHLHTAFGLGWGMYARQHAGFLELELADWKDHRMFRVAAVDRGELSFVDVRIGSWPVVLITHPTPARFRIPGRESKHCTNHVRVLAFSTANITSVRVQLDDGACSASCVHVKGPLFVCPYPTSLPSRGPHELTVEAIDSVGRSAVDARQFSTDGTAPSFPIVSRILLMADFVAVFRLLYFLSIVVSVLPLALLRVRPSTLKLVGRRGPGTSSRLVKRWHARLWLLANHHSFYYILIMYPLYITLGPWMVGRVVDDSVGMVFLWGTVVNGRFLPGDITYLYGFLQMVTHQLPLTMILGIKLQKRLDARCPTTTSMFISALSRSWAELPWLVLFALQLVLLLLLWRSHGLLSAILSSFRLWPVLTSAYVWIKAYTVPIGSLRQLDDIYNGCNTVDPHS